jgi:hypothetical protein
MSGNTEEKKTKTKGKRVASKFANPSLAIGVNAT